MSDLKIRGDVAPLLQIQHLGESKKLAKDYDEVSGILYGPSLITFIPLVLDDGKKKIYAVFLVDNGSPTTFVSDQTLRSFGIEFSGKPVKILINGCRFSVERAFFGY